jgi:hypothetical protein
VEEGGGTGNSEGGGGTAREAEGREAEGSEARRIRLSTSSGRASGGSLPDSEEDSALDGDERLERRILLA